MPRSVLFSFFPSSFRLLWERFAKNRYVGIALLGRLQLRLAQLCESLAKPLLRCEGLEGAPLNTTVLAARERLGGEVVDTGVEAVLEHVGKDLFFFFPSVSWVFSLFVPPFQIFLWLHRPILVVAIFADERKGENGEC